MNTNNMRILTFNQDYCHTSKIDRQNQCIHPITLNENSQRKSVRFAPGKSKTYEIDAIDQQFSRFVWYSRAEFQFIKSKRVMIVKQLKSGKLIEDKDDTSRGLESLLDKRLQKLRLQMKFNTLCAVLDEQYYQKSRYGVIVDTEMLSFVYRMNGSEKCQKIAYEIAQRDFESAIIDNSDRSEYQLNGSKYIADFKRQNSYNNDVRKHISFAKDTCTAHPCRLPKLRRQTRNANCA